MLESLHAFDLPGPQVAFQIGLIDLVDGKFADVVLGLAHHILPISLMDLQQSVGAQFGLIDAVLVALVENEMQHPFGLHIHRQVSSPDVLGR